MDEENKLLEGVNIFIPELNKGTLTNSSGHYEITGIPNGEIKIYFSFIGFSPRIETIKLKGNDVELNAILYFAILETEEIVVSAGYDNTQHENAVKIDVLKLNPTQQKNTPNLVELLTKIPGVDMISKGNGVSKPVIRGLSMNDILVLNNGVRLENYQYSDHHPLGVDEFGISTVEIIKGPASLLYGSDAIGGVLNFIKEKPAPIGYIVGDFTTQLFSNSHGMTNNLGVKGSSEMFFGGIRLGQKTNSDYLQGGGNFVPNSRFNEQSLKMTGGVTHKTGVSKIFYDYNKQNLGLTEEEAIEKISKRGRYNKIYYQELSTHLLSVRNKFYLGNFKLDINAAVQSTDLEHVEEEKETEMEMNLTTVTYEARLHLKATDKTEINLGVQGFNQQNTNLNHREVLLLPNAFTDSYSALMFGQYAVGERLKLQAGMRYDFKHISTTTIGNMEDSATYRPAINNQYGRYNGSIGANFNLSEKLIVRANFASAFRTPTLAELSSNGPHELRYEIGNKNLKPETSRETDLNLHYHNSNWTLDIAGFYNTIQNYIFITPTGDTSVQGISVYQFKQANSILFGGELGVHLHPFSIHWLHVESTFAAVKGQLTNGENLPLIPAHKLNFELRGEKERLLGMRNGFASISSHTALNQTHISSEETPTKGYTLIYLGVGSSIKLKEQSLIWSVGINNAFDTKYIDHLSTLKEVNYFNPGRNVSISIQIPFEVRMNNKNTD